MPVTNYGVWKARAAGSIVESHADDRRSPHLSLYYHEDPNANPDFDPSLRDDNNNIPGFFRAAINIKSGHRQDSRLVYWVNGDFEQHRMAERLDNLPFGFRPLRGATDETRGLDYIRGNLFNTPSGRRLFHDLPGPDNDIIEVLQPEIDDIVEKQADIYLFGARFGSNDGIHDVHMNQGNARQWKNDDGVFQDGGLVIHRKDSNQWVGIFLAFASQAVHTDNRSGHAISSMTWDNFLLPDIIENAVVIKEAYVNPGPGQSRSVTLSNLMNRRVPLENWTIHSSAGGRQLLPLDYILAARGTELFEVPDCPLSTDGDIITLVNEEGLKVVGVSYNRTQGSRQGSPIVFR